MTGISEILLLILLVSCIFILPRMFQGKPIQKKEDGRTILKRLPAKTRGLIVASIAYPLFMALYLKPWQGNGLAFVSYGLFPVFLFGAMVWIFSARKK
ncbi:MAG: hypothetical protein A3J85_00560 [Desulfobacula sp. RIFOXYA12_FULL_46_16]|nr:MAG: hypothetical protein A3J85_00560 [Desulfobacula sp. RIFOXYA12_FULL_46_16]